MERRGVVVTNTPDVLTDATADMAMALLLAAARRVCEGDRLIRAGGWRDAGPEFLLGREVTGKTLGIVGFGRIGQAMARRASGFGMRILYSGPRDAGVPGATRTDLDLLLATSDFVSLHCPLTDATRDLLSRERIARMKPGAILVNTSRGPVVDEEALADALEDGRLFAAGLDVFRDEPRVPDRLRAAANAVLTPHVGSGTVETRTAMARMVWDEVLRRATGRPPAHRVVV
jgi:glyoxylate reductase